MSNIDQQFVEYVVKSLVGNPDAVVVDRRVDDKGVLLELTVDPEDLGRVIGKRGATAQSLRTLLRALGTKNEARYNLKIVDNGVGAGGSSDDNTRKKRDDDQRVSDASSNSSTSADDDGYTQSSQADAPEPQAAEPDTNDRLAQTRRELADLDDLDV